MAIENGDRERLRQLERRMENVETLVPLVAELRGEVKTMLGEIQADITQIRETEKEERSATFAEKALLWGSGGVVLAAVITAAAQLAGGA